MAEQPEQPEQAEQAEEWRGGAFAIRRVWLTRQPDPSACCPTCGTKEIANVRTFATGSGTVFRTLIDDVYCRRCGYMGQPDFMIAEREPRRGGGETK